MEKQPYKVQTVTFAEENQARLTGELFYYGGTRHAEWHFRLHSATATERLWEGNLNELIELILLGSLCLQSSKQHTIATNVGESDLAAV